MGKRLEREEGFTLIELLVVMIVIGILAAIAIPIFMNQRASARDAEAKSDLRNLATLEEVHLNDKTFYGKISDLISAGEDVKVSQGVTLTVVRYDGTSGYCLSGKHADSTKTWFYDSRNFGLQAPNDDCSSKYPSGTAGDSLTG